ncbi:hypothetical protein PoB_002003300 [Plakobranchus ocellatus]|uniref:Uncharacterized protein n=1 Tax=Plakobranchus ocellatus TaxID=259542 RepID=A0AAV3ZFI6_9GAST|nr:hypothetical protein PoB_002003300 [Plakobranchus ocellatus]
MAAKNTLTSGTAGSHSGAAPRVARTSIHTPLQPASVQDLKAKFDQHNKTGGSTGATESGGTSPRRQKKGPEAAAAAAAGLKKGILSSSTSDSKPASSAGVSLSGLSSSLQAAAQRKVGSGAAQSSSSSSLSSLSQPSTTNLSSTAKSSIALTTARPFQPLTSATSSKSSATSSSGRNSPILGKTVGKSAAGVSSSLSSSSSSSLSSSSSSITTKTTRSENRWEPKCSKASSGAGANKSNAFSKSDFRNSFERDKEGRLELPVMHISTSGSEVTLQSRNQNKKWSETASSDVKKDVTGSRNLGKKVSETKGAFDKPSVTSSASVISSKANTRVESSSKASTPSPPVQRTKKIIAREIKIERLDSGANITTYKDGGGIAGVSASSIKSSNLDSSQSNAARNGAVGPGKKIVEIKVQQGSSSGRSSPASPASTASSTGSRLDQERVPEFRQVKLRKTSASEDKSTSRSGNSAGLAVKDSGDSNKRLSRKISAERFERLMFDFQRGVPTEAEVDLSRRGSETDHILLQEKVRALAGRSTDGRGGRGKSIDGGSNDEENVEEVDVPIINRKKKEESIFTEGLKVSDFVKQVNKLNPGAETAPPPKWKLQRAQSQASSAASSEVGADSYYQGIPGEDEANLSGEDDIYEKVTHRGKPSSL